jgi:hexosaminidase
MSNAVATLTGKNMRIGQSSKKQVKLEFVKEQQLGEEGYHITVTTTAISIAANNRKGIMYGIQSLLQLFPAARTNAAIEIPCTEITDYPRFTWRGMHLDVSRHFFGPELIRDYIDLLYRYKINTFHWHLVDDQGWRIEIKKYPKLTTVGAWRANKNELVWGSRPQATADDKSYYGGYYTQEQIKELVAYARERNITIVPEIEMPGHVASAIAAYLQLSCNKQPQLSLTGGNYTGVSSNYCAGSEEVFRFNEDVLNEVIALFPSDYIHIGGDEVDKTPWKNCASCQKRMQVEKLKDEEELQSYFIKRIEKYLTAKGRKLMGWDEILEGGLADSAAVMSWRGESGGIQAAKMNHSVVMTPGNPYYFDHYQAGPEGEPFAIGGMNTLKKVYEYDPVPATLPVEKAKYILGGQANLWTEYITHRSQLEYMLLPRLLALSEGLWCVKETKDWNGFTKRLKPHFFFLIQKDTSIQKDPTR